MVSLKEVIEEIRNLGKEYRKQNGDSPLPANKDFNLWLVQQFMDLKSEVASNKAKIKMLCWTIGIVVPILLVVSKLA